MVIRFVCSTGKVNEVKNQAGSEINNLPGDLGKLEFIDFIKNVKEDNIESLVESEDGILNNLDGKTRSFFWSLLTDWGTLR